VRHLLERSPVLGLALVLVADQPAPDRATEMRGHFDHALAIHAAVIRGDLPAVKPQAQALAGIDPSTMPPGPATQIGAVRSAAGDVAKAGTVLEAARSAAVMLTACGQCHRATGARPTLPAGSRPSGAGLTGHMQQHQEAANQLLLGLLEPSEDRWRAGALALAAAPLHPKELPVDSALRRQIAPTEDRVHRLATEAVQATDPIARTDYYGQILAGCADCHTRVAARPVP
jgi:cytochrome c553